MKAPATIIMKLSARCNLKCDYCYMFEHADQSYLKKTAIMPMEIFRTAVDQFAEYAKKYQWQTLRLSLHGGEPLLVGKQYLDEAASYTRQQLSFIPQLSMSIQTNAVLIDPEWIDLFLKHQIQIGISLDGTKTANDLHRVDHKGRSTYEKTVRGIRYCLDAGPRGLSFGGLLAVIDPRISGREAYRHFVDELGVRWVDFLLPDGNHEAHGQYHQYPALSYARFLTEVFDEWWERQDPNIGVRFLESLVDLLIGGDTQTESLGLGMAHLLVVETDGSLEPLDVLRICGNEFTRQNLYIGRNRLEDFYTSPLIQKLAAAANQLPKACQGCRYRKICGGGYMPHRYSHSNGFNNPSLYCTDLKAIIEHVWQRVHIEINNTVQQQGGINEHNHSPHSAEQEIRF